MFILRPTLLKKVLVLVLVLFKSIGYGADLGSAGCNALMGALFNWWGTSESIGTAKTQPTRDTRLPSIDLGITVGTPGLGNLVVQKKLGADWGIKAAGIYAGSENWGAQTGVSRSFYYENDGSETSYGIQVNAGLLHQRVTGFGSPTISDFEYLGVGLEGHLVGFFGEISAAYGKMTNSAPGQNHHEYGVFPLAQLGYMWSFK